MNFTVLDIATAPIADVVQFLEPVSADKNLVDPEKIKKNIAEKEAAQLSKSGLDLDLCRITGIGVKTQAEEWVTTCVNEEEERELLSAVGSLITKQGVNAPLIGYNALKFDWPVLGRRARYLGVSFPEINLDRYRSPHYDLFDKLTNHGVLSSHSLRFYVARLGWLDLVKPSSGEEESRVHETGKWDELHDSIKHDVEATFRLAKWLGVIR